MKLDRAKKHMLELRVAVHSFLNTHPYSFSGKPDLQKGTVNYTMDTVKPVPCEIPIIAGDVIQTLRSALDQLAYQLYRRGPGGKGDGKHIYFPIAENKLKYENQKRGQTLGISSQAIAAIDAIQPYGGGNDVLWYLHALNTIDKHRLILTAGSAVRSVDLGKYIQQKAPKESSLSRVNLSTFFKAEGGIPAPPLEVGTVVLTDLTSPEVVEFDIAFEIAFFEKNIIEGKPLLAKVQDMIDAVEKVIGNLKPFTV